MRLRYTICIIYILGFTAQTVKQTNERENVVPGLSSKTSSDSITTTGINSVWEPSSDEANPSSITIMRIEATSAPKIQITPTSSTSHKQIIPSSSSIIGEVAESLQSFQSSSSSEFSASANMKSPKKTSEKKIESPLIKDDKSEGITNQVETENNDGSNEESIDRMIQKQSDILNEFKTKKVKKVDSSSSISFSSTTAKDLTENEDTSSQGISTDDKLQIPSLASSSSLPESSDASSLDPTPLDVPTSWSLSSTQTETTLVSKLESVSLSISK